MTRRMRKFVSFLREAELRDLRLLHPVLGRGWLVQGRMVSLLSFQGGSFP